MRFRDFFFLFLFLALVFSIELIGGALTAHSVGSWYLTLQKPEWNPPSWVFGPVWTILYATIGVSGWLVFRKRKSEKKSQRAFIIYGLQLLSNVLWSYFFFFLKNPFLALLNIFALLFLICLNIAAFKKIYRPAGLLLVPYLIWTLYAAALNFAIWSLN